MMRRFLWDLCFPLLVFLLFFEVKLVVAQAPAPQMPDPLKDSVEKYQKQKQPERELFFAERWAEKLKKENKVAGSEYGDALASWGNALYRAGKSNEAEPLLLQGLEIRKKTLGENHPDVAVSFTHLGGLYRDLGNYPLAASYFLQALEVRKVAFGENHPQVAASLQSLGAVCDKMGHFQKSEAYYVRALEIRKKAFGEGHFLVGASLSSLGTLYKEMGNYLKAETFHLQALEIRRKALGEYHLEVAASFNNLGGVYIQLHRYADAETYLLQALEIRKRVLGENHPEYAHSLNNLGIFFYNTDQYQRAESYYLQSLEIKRKLLGENNPEFVESLGNLGILFMDMGQYPKAESFHLLTLGTLRKALGESHPEVAMVTSYLGNVYFSMGKMAKAEALYLEWNTKKQDQIQRYFPFLSDQEKARFYESNILSAHDEFLSFCVQRYGENKAIAGEVYNDQLATKGLLLNSSAKWKHRIKTAGDKKLNRLYDEWETSQNALSQLLQSTDSTERAGVDSVERKTEKMEKELSLRSENFARLADKKKITWKEVQKALKPGEAAIEVVRVQKFGITRTVADSWSPAKTVYKIKGLTDTIFYAVLIVKPESVYPEMVVLKNGNELEGKALAYYQRSIAKQMPDIQSYGKFWEKIGSRLGNSHRIYFSPDGVFHHINLNTLFNPGTKKYLLEEKDIRLVTASKDLINPNPMEEENKLAELLGFPDYYGGGPAEGTSRPEPKSPVLKYGLRLEMAEPLAELPGTRDEVEKIAKVLETKGWEVKSHIRASAREATIKESYKPRVLHIATHGFFQPDTTEGSNPLLRSGLMLTGAGSTLKEEKNESGEDGILTAYEAMNLNLDNTDLVVLSACETGLGEIKNGEGVYGLQRAFKVAGARSLIMSLWKVDDEATQELMVAFYKNWLGGTSKRAAFLKAQKELKVKYPNPYFWGAFVMVGE